MIWGLYYESEISLKNGVLYFFFKEAYFKISHFLEKKTLIL